MLECFSAAVIDPKGPKHFSHFVPSPFSKGLLTRQHREGLAPNLLFGHETDPIYTILAILFLEQGYATIFIYESLFYMTVSVSHSCAQDILSKLSNSGYK